MADLTFEAVVIGGGFFGCEIARKLSERLDRVAIFEKESNVLTRASYSNQARIHGGYHYPRSVLTASRSRINYHRWMEDYAEAVVPGITSYYAVASKNSHVTGEQFRGFMERIEAPVTEPPPKIKDLFDPNMVEAVFEVDESIFDAIKLRRLMRQKMLDKVKVFTGTAVSKLEKTENPIRLSLADNRTVEAEHVFICTYSMINSLLAPSGLPIIPLKHELTELPLVEVPPQFNDIAITVMCGPFFALLPFPPKQAHSLSHVRYTPHHEWHDSEESSVDAHHHLDQYNLNSRFPEMVRDASRYIPSLSDCRHLGDSILEVKTVLPRSETDDSRPILMQQNHGLRGLNCVLGAKIDNIYDVLEEVDKMKL